MPEEVLCFLWYLCAVYTIGISFDIKWLYQYVNAQQGVSECLATFLTWFAPLHNWSGKLRRSAKSTNLPYKKLKNQGGLNPFFNPHTIYFFHRHVQVNTKSNKIHALPTLIHHKDFQRGVRPDFNIFDSKIYEEFQTHAFRLNNARQTFPIPFNPIWTYYPIDYQMNLDEDVQFYFASLERKALNQIKQEPILPESSSPECPPEYFQDAQLPADSLDSMEIEEIAKDFNIDIKDDNEPNFEEPEPEYECPGDYYGCCDDHIIEFEIDH